MIAAPSFGRVADLSDQERAAIRSLSQAVYPPAESAEWPGRHIEWAEPEWCGRVWGEQGELASYVGALLRQGTLDGKSVWIGGVGGLMTHPALRRRGYAEQGLSRAVGFFREHGSVAFGLLVCEPRLLPYYGRLGWCEFVGDLRVRQRGATERFTFNRVMTVGVAQAAPLEGVIDLCGRPW